MSCCDGCGRRTATCHAECADYLAERVLRTHDTRDAAEREYENYITDVSLRGGRTRGGNQEYKIPNRTAWYVRTRRGH